MPPLNHKEAKMACSLSEETVFIRKLEGFRADCSDIISQHLTVNPDVIWEPEDGPGPTPRTKREKAKLKLVLDLTFDEQTGKPIFPPANTRLSDELVYLATKFETGPVRAVRYPYDFDKSGDIDPDRVPSGPAPIIWAHGLPFFPVYRGYYILCGREHAECVGWLLHEKTRVLMHKSPMWSIGAVVAPDSAVKLTHTIERQMIFHRPQGCEKDLRYKGKAWTRDVVTAEHHLCAVFPILGAEDIDVCPLWMAEGYNVKCGPPHHDVKPSVMPKEFFASHGIVNIDYAFLARPYSNDYLDSDDEEPGERKDSDKGVERAESGDLPGTCGEVTSNNQTVNTHSASQMDVDMEIDSLAEISQMVPEQEQEKVAEAITRQTPAQDTDPLSEQVSEQALEQPPEEATDVVMEQGPEDVKEDPGVTHSRSKDNPGVDSSATASPGQDLSMTAEDSNAEASGNSILERTDTVAIISTNTDMSTEGVAIIETTSVQLIAEQPEKKQPEVAPTGEISTSASVTMEQVAHKQPDNEKSYHTAAGDVPEKSSFAEHPAVQLVSNNENQISEQAPVEEGG